MAKIPDRLLPRARAGDVDAFTDLISPSDQGMRSLVFSVVGDPHLMDDVLQRTYLTAFQEIPAFRGEVPFRTWLYRICWTTLIDVLRARTMPTSPHAEPRPESHRGAGPDVVVEPHGAWDTAWARLDHDERAAVVLVVEQRLSHEQAGSVLGVHPMTVASRVTRACAHLRAARVDHATAHHTSAYRASSHHSSAYHGPPQHTTPHHTTPHRTAPHPGPAR